MVTTGEYFVGVVRTRSDLAATALAEEAIRKLAEDRGRVGYLMVMECTADLAIPAELRQAINGMVERHTKSFAAAALVFEERGFKATAFRSFVTAVNLAARASHPNKVFGDVGSAVTWLRHTAPQLSPSAQGLLGVVKELRERLAAGAGDDTRAAGGQWT